MAVEIWLWIFDGVWIYFGKILNVPLEIDSGGSNVLDLNILNLHITYFLMEV